MQICGVENCEGRVLAKEMCGMHYARVRRTGITDSLPPKPRLVNKCSVYGCEAVPKGKTLCQTHYSRLRRTGSTEAPILNKNKVCSDVKCSATVLSSGLCSVHVERRRWVSSGKKRNAQARERYAKNPNPKRLNAQKWALANPLTVKLNNQKKRSRKRNAEGSVSNADWINLCNRFSGKCAYCTKISILTIDHVVPLSRGGTNWIGNILPACKSCNSSKNDSLLIEWRTR